MDATDNLPVDQVAEVSEVPDEEAPDSSEAYSGQRSSSELVFISSNKDNDESNGATTSKESGDEGSQDCLALDPPNLGKNSEGEEPDFEEVDSIKTESPETIENCDVQKGDEGVDESIVLLEDSGEKSNIDETAASLKLKSVKCVKAPLPELVPIEASPASPLDSSSGGRSVRQAALISAEKTKMMSRMERFPTAATTTSEKIKVTPDLMNGGSVSVEKKLGINIEHCHQCKKFDLCNFQTTSQYGQSGLQFCSRRCAKNYFKSKRVCFVNRHEKEEPKSSDDGLPDLSGSLQDIVVEPDIEIHTFPDDYSIDCQEDSDGVGFSNGALTSSSAVDDVIETAVRETLTCVSCSSPLINLADALIWEALEFCSEKCLRTHIQVIGSHCNSCSSKVSEQVLGKLCVRFGAVIRQFCSSECLEKFKARHKLCSQCQINMLNKEQVYCSKVCEELNARLQNKLDFMGQRFCAVCKQYKTVCEEVILEGLSNWLCSKPCRNAFRFAHKITTLSCGICSRFFDAAALPRYAVRKSEVAFAIRLPELIWFCSSTCHATHLLKQRKIELCNRCQVKKYNVDMIRKMGTKKETEKIYYCSTLCLNSHTSLQELTRRKTFVENNTAAKPTPPPPAPASASSQTVGASAKIVGSAAKMTTTDGSTVIPIEVTNKIIFVPPTPKEMKNMSIWCRPAQTSQSVQTTSETTDDEDLQSDPDAGTKPPLAIPVLIPIPVPIYVPVPMMMYNCPAPVPFPCPIPIPTPVVMPVESSLMNTIVQTIEESKKDTIMHQHPLEEEVLRLAEALGSSNNDCDPLGLGADIQEDIPAALLETLCDLDREGSPLIGEDFEETLSTTSISFDQGSRKRCSQSNSVPPAPKRFKPTATEKNSSDIQESCQSPIPNPPGAFRREAGYSVWSRWMKEKEEMMNPCRKLSEMNIQEINSNLSDFVRSLRRPNGKEYRPDIILYFLYGLQLNLSDSNRTENLFMECALEPFQLQLDALLEPFYQRLFKAINEDQSVVLTTALSESHLWECRQLGVDSPIVLVFTMLYFNTKYFRLYTVEQHEQLSFACVHSVTKKAVHSPGVSNGSSGCRMPQKVSNLQLIPLNQQKITSNARVIPPMEQPQNVIHPTECPTKHYSFYLSKCPESMRTRQDAFYLVPEVSCSPDSPVWYSTQSVPRPLLARMLHRVLLIQDVIHNLRA